MSASELEELLAFQIKAAGLPEPLREFHFAPPRRWRADFAYPGLLIEVDGGQWVPHGGRHNTDADRAKLNAAALSGYRVLRFSGEMIQSGEALEMIEKALK